MGDKNRGQIFTVVVKELGFYQRRHGYYQGTIKFILGCYLGGQNPVNFDTWFATV